MNRRSFKRAARGHILWTEHKDRLLGTAHDEVIAKRLGCSAITILKRRQKLGIVSYRLRPWTPGEDNLLGTMPDALLARKLKRTTSGVRRRRWEKGIRFFTPQSHY